MTSNLKLNLSFSTALLLFILIPVFISSGCTPPENQQESARLFDGPNPWPEIRQERITTLLAPAMERAGVEAWAVVCRSNNNDPLAAHVGCENAVAPAVFAFQLHGDQVFSLAFTPPGEAAALQELALQDSVVVVDYNVGAIRAAAAWLSRSTSGPIALNFSENNAFADGLSHTQFNRLRELLSPSARARMVSSEELVYEWLSVKLPAEVAIMAEAAAVTAQWQHEAYAQVVPGVSTDRDIADFLKAKMREAGVTDAWAPDQNPLVNSGPDRGHAHATDRVIQHGDVIQIDFGIRVYDRWVTDIQRFAYVLQPGETEPPAHIQRYWEVAREGNRRALATMRPGATGLEVDVAQREWLRENGSLEVFWSTGHPVGYQAHDVGPNLGGGQLDREPSPFAFRELREGMVFAFDGFYKWDIEGGTKTISVEEMAVVTADGAEYLTPPQEELILIP
ncbi:M24 family metallopeptidase [Cyclonatronum proteinivorum]|nr:M24 family metallopeptidase [Cyclonatronum proteinivorum]